MKIEIFLRTHDASNVHAGAERYCNFSKSTLALGCTRSLIRSLNQFRGTVQLIVSDDHSSDSFVNDLKESLTHCRFPYKLIHLDQSGNNYSCLKQFELCHDSTADLVYSVEDDYLHCESAISEMVENYLYFKSKLNNEVAMFPYDAVEEYEPPWLGPSVLVRGTRRHWKTGPNTTGTFMCSPEIVRKYWHHFYDLATYYVPWQDHKPGQTSKSEQETICQIWKNHVTRFNPIPSLALHMQFEQHRDPYINWQDWWDRYACSF